MCVWQWRGAGQTGDWEERGQGEGGGGREGLKGTFKLRPQG